jgi:hypothetical protein
MKTLRILVATAAVFATGSTFAAGSNLGDPALSLSNVSVGVEAGTTGYGVNFAYAVLPSTSLNVGWAGGTFPSVHGNSINVGGTKYRTNYSQFENTSVIIKYSPFSAPYYNWVNVAFGSYFQDNEVRLTSPTATGKLTTSRLNPSPYLGFGIAPKIDDHWGVNVDLGVIYQGRQTVELTPTTPGATVNNTLADQYKWAPVAKAGVSYRF